MKKALVLIGVLICAVVMAGCSTATSKRLNQLELGMTQAQVKKILGGEYTVKASRTEASGAVLQMWEYRDSKTDEAYRIFFKDGTLAQWGTQGRMDFPDLHVPAGK